MSRDELKKKADALALSEWRNYAFQSANDLAQSLFEFALKVIAEERESCAKLAEADQFVRWERESHIANEDIAAAIRARG